MITESGRVVAIEPDAVWVETIRRSSCQSCAVRKGCGHSLLARSGGKCQHIRVLLGDFDVAEVRIHDQVEIGVPEQLVMVGTVLVYLVPLFGLLLGALIATHATRNWGFNPDVVAVLGAAVGFGMALLLVRWHAFRHRNNLALQPVLTAVSPPLSTQSASPIIAAAQVDYHGS